MKQGKVTIFTHSIACYVDDHYQHSKPNKVPDYESKLRRNLPYYEQKNYLSDLYKDTFVYKMLKDRPIVKKWAPQEFWQFLVISYYSSLNIIYQVWCSRAVCN